MLVTNRTQILELTPRGTHVFLDFGHRPLAGIEGLDAEGLASDSSGDLYLDTWPSGYTNGKTVALVELRTNGTGRVLWRSR